MPRVTNDVACLWHLAHMCTGKGAKELAVNIEDFVIDIYYHFRRSAKRKAQLIKHVSTRWLSLGKCLERTLNPWDCLESYFVSYFDLQDDPEADGQTNRETRLEKAFKSPVTRLYAMFVKCVMPVFDSYNPSVRGTTDSYVTSVYHSSVLFIADKIHSSTSNFFLRRLNPY